MTIRICQNFRLLQNRKVLKNMVEVKCILPRQLKGEQMDCTKASDANEMGSDAANGYDVSIRNIVRQHKKNWKRIYFISVCIVVVTAVLFVKVVNGSFTQMSGCLYVSILMLFFAGWICFFAKDLLPTYYDKNKVNYVSQGIFRVHMTGLSFNNGNWGYICIVFKCFTLGIAVLYPIVFYICVFIGGSAVWDQIRYITLGIMLIAMVIVVYIVGKKYE